MSATAGSAVRTGDGRRLVLGTLLKSGGAGSIYLMPGSPLQVAKIYHDSANHEDYEHKVAAMLDLSPHLPDLIENGHRYVQIAWPEALLRDEQGRFLGFLMPAVDVQATSELECILQERQARAAHLPTGLGAKVTLAANLAAVIAALHVQGHHVIDLKPVNLRFYPQSLYMAMLDCDGFSIQGRGARFAADQITPDYLAPEFQENPLPAGAETQQDLFALAVVIFQLLNFGIHPFTGRPNSDHVPTDIPARIAHRCYAYGMRANPDLAPSPVSGHRSMPSALRLLFDRAFESVGPTRPSANEWVVLLKGYALRSSHLLAICGADKGHQHFAGLPCAACARAALIADAARNATVARATAPPSNVMARAIGIRAPHFTYGTHLPQPLLRTSQSWQRLSPMPPRPTWPARRSLRSMNRFELGVLILLLALPLAATVVSKFHGQDPQMKMAAPEDLTEWSVVPMPYSLAAVRANVESAAASAASGTVANAAGSMSMLRVLASTHPRSSNSDAERADLEGFMARLSGPQAAFQAMADHRILAIARYPYDSELAYELGWLCVMGKQREAAKGWFLRGIWSDPDNPKDWFGLGVASNDDNEAVGALAIAEKLAQGNSNGDPESKDFRPAVIRLAGIEPNHFVALLARARQIAVASN